MDRLFLSLIFWFFISFSMRSMAQELSVKTAALDMADLKASVDPRLDKKGNPCALLKISAPSIENMKFGDKIIDCSYSAGEYYVYVPSNAKRIEILHPNYKPLEIRFKDYGLKLEPKMTYSIQLKPCENVFSIMPLENKRSQYVGFQITPKDAKITINGETLTSRNGTITKLLPIGIYNYKAFALDYHDLDASFALSQECQSSINVDLIPTFGWISIQGNDESQDAYVFINDSLIGQLPVKTDRLTSGIHTLTVKKDMYKTYQDLILVEDAKTANVQIELERNYSFVSIDVDNEVEVLINDTLRSIGPWYGKLLKGTHRIEARKDNFISEHKTINVEITDKPIMVEMPKLEPMTGTLMVNFEKGTEVWIGNEMIGISPLTKTLTQGIYKVVMKKEGYNDNVASAIIKYNQECSIWGKMVPRGDEYLQSDANPQYSEEHVRQFDVINVVCLGHVTESPMKMFDGDEKTSFNVSQFTKIIPSGDDWDDNIVFYNKFQLYLGLDCIQCMVDSIGFIGGNCETAKSFNDSSSPCYVIFHEPQDFCSQSHYVSEQDSLGEFKYNYDKSRLYHTQQWQGRKIGIERDNGYGVGTRTLALRFLSYQSTNVYVSELNIFGCPSLSWGHYEPYEDSDFLKRDTNYE